MNGKKLNCHDVRRWCQPTTIQYYGVRRRRDDCPVGRELASVNSLFYREEVHHIVKTLLISTSSTETSQTLSVVPCLPN